MNASLPSQGGAAPALSVCIIGRNEARHLRACAASLAQLAQAGIRYETIFVDSASSDASAPIAAEVFDTLVVLRASAGLNAGAARHVATARARAAYILYLDADMELLPTMVAPIAALLQAGDPLGGLCGYTVNHFDGGGCDRIEFPGNRDGQPCRMFGGAVLLPRQLVLDAGNWPTTLFAYEETELYSRLGSRGARVTWHALDFVKHKTPRVASRAKLAGQLLPWASYLGKKYYGAGQVTRHTLANGNFLRFARIKPEPYLLLLALGLGLAGALASAWALLLPLAAAAALVAVGGPKSLFVYGCWVPQVALGWFRLAPGFVPEIDIVREKAGAAARGPDGLEQRESAV